MGQVRTVATVTMRTPWIYVLPALVALFLLLPSLYPEASTGGADILERYGAENYMETSRRLQQWRDDGVDGELVALEERALEALGRAREATDDKAFFQAAADYENVTLALVERGVWEDDELFMRANSLNVVRIAGLAEPVVYTAVGELPALPYLAFVYEQVPWLLWVGTPCLVAVAGVLSRTNGRLLALGPCQVVGSLGSGLFSGLLSWAMVMGAFVLAALLVAARGGWGDPAYPAVFVQGDRLETLGCADVLLRASVVILALSLFVGMLVEAAFSPVGDGRVPAAVVAVFALLPMVVGHDGAPWAPWSYVHVAQTAGVCAYFNGGSLSETPQAFPLALTVLFGWVTGLSVLALVGNALRRTNRL